VSFNGNVYIFDAGFAWLLPGEGGFKLVFSTEEIFSVVFLPEYCSTGVQIR
jgi:hypothetical protein